VNTHHVGTIIEGIRSVEGGQSGLVAKGKKKFSVEGGRGQGKGFVWLTRDSEWESGWKKLGGNRTLRRVGQKKEGQTIQVRS